MTCRWCGSEGKPHVYESCVLNQCSDSDRDRRGVAGSITDLGAATNEATDRAHRSAAHERIDRANASTADEGGDQTDVGSADENAFSDEGATDQNSDPNDRVADEIAAAD